jgi:hypothetical protein
MGLPIFTELPEDILEAVRILLVYFTLPRSGNPRPLYPKVVKRAARLLGVCTDWEVPKDAPNRWRLPKKEQWRSRWVLAGLDPDTLQIVNRSRWDLAWEQLKENRFSAEAQQKAISIGREAPPAEPVLTQVKSKPKERPQSTFNQYLPGDLKGRLTGRGKPI